MTLTASEEAPAPSTLTAEIRVARWARAEFLSKLKRYCWQRELDLQVTTFKDGGVFSPSEFGLRVKGPQQDLVTLKTWMEENLGR